VEDLLDTVNSYTSESPLHGDLHSGSRRAEKDDAHLGIILIKSLDVDGVYKEIFLLKPKIII